MNLEKLRASIDQNESFEAKPYRDHLGLWTIGIGRCLETNPLIGAEWSYLLQKGLIKVEITPEGAQVLRDGEINRAVNVLSSGRFWLTSTWNQMSDARRNVLVEMVYQMGVERFAGFVDMIEAIRRRDWKRAALEGLDSKWAKVDTPNRAKKLMSQFERGEFV